MVNRVRRITQIVSALAMNANWSGFVTGRIWQGQSKRVCVPGLNCYSCPAAVGACPMGALQFALASGEWVALAYTLGFLMVFGLALGRAVCGFVCPFGLIQEWIGAPFQKNRRRTFSVPGRLRYGVLAVFVVAFPLTAYAATGLGTPAFCKYICPAGTLEAGLPLLFLNPLLRDAAGVLFGWKAFVLACMIVACVFVYRPFCRVCPLGAVYGLFNRVAVVGIAVDSKTCTGCGGCAKGCPMNTACDTRACIRCGHCVSGCAAGAVGFTFFGGRP